MRRPNVLPLPSAVVSFLQSASQQADVDDEWYSMESAGEIKTSGAPESSGFSVYMTKWHVYASWMLPSMGGASFDVIGSGDPCQPIRPGVLDRNPSRKSERLAFFGDLDPLDLTTYLLLNVGVTIGDSDLSPPGEVGYCGVGDELISLAERHVRPQRGSLLDSISIPMSSFERKHFEYLECVWPGVEEIVGERSIAILRSGRKIEVEGIVNPRIYVDGYVAALIGWISGLGTLW